MEKQYPNEEQLHATGIERSFIACLMKYPDLIITASSAISVDDIYSIHYHLLYKTILMMKEFYDRKQEKYCFSQELICLWIEKLDSKDKKMLDETITQYSFLNTIQSARGVDVESFGKYLDILRRSSALIKAYRASVDLQEKIMNPSNSINAQELVMEASSIFSNIRVDDTSSVIGKMGDCMDALMQDIEFNKENKGRMGIWLPKFPRLMKVLNGIRRTQFIILFARPKTGKSSLLLDMALSTAIQNIPTLYIDTEMTVKEQASRALSNWSGVREWDIVGGDYENDKDKADKVIEYSNKLKNAPLYYVAAKGGNINTICSYIREFVDRYVGYEILSNGVKKTRECLVVYDWLKIADSDSIKKVNEYQELGFLATSLNDVRRELDVPLIAGAQANRFGNDKDVGVNAASNAQNFLADSDRLLRFCTCLIWLRRLNFEETNLMKDYAETNPEEAYNQMIHVVDQRGGPVCIEGIGLRFTGETLSYQEFDPINLSEMKNKTKKRTKAEKVVELSKGNDNEKEFAEEF